jgi:myo-inositol-1-phosphate synthase
MTERCRVCLIDVGNNASAIVQGVQYYTGHRDALGGDGIFPKLCG